MTFFDTHVLTYRMGIDAILEDNPDLERISISVENATQLRCIAQALEDNSWLQKIRICSSPNLYLSEDPDAENWLNVIERKLLNNRGGIEDNEIRTPHLGPDFEHKPQSMPMFALD